MSKSQITIFPQKFLFIPHLIYILNTDWLKLESITLIGQYLKFTDLSHPTCNSFK